MLHLILKLVPTIILKIFEFLKKIQEIFRLVIKIFKFYQPGKFDMIKITFPKIAKLDELEFLLFIYCCLCSPEAAVVQK